MTTVIIAVVVLAVLGAIFGLVLAIASKVFAVEVDPREEAILGCLPGANCGGCGYPGCSGYASAVVKGVAPVNACAAGGEAVAAQIGEIMGVSAGAAVKQIAQVHWLRPELQAVHLRGHPRLRGGLQAARRRRPGLRLRLPGPGLL